MSVSSSLKSLLTVLVGIRGKKRLKFYRLRLLEFFGGEPYTGLAGLDRKLIDHLPKDRPGFFIEAGANDGVDQSNTYYLERKLGWTGLLIEPSEHLAGLARAARKATVVQAALGAPEDSGTVISFPFGDLVSSIGRGSATASWGGLFGENPKTVTATIRTMSEILDEAGSPAVDLLSLDVEGYEIPVLKGLDLERHRPRRILIETADIDAVLDVVGHRYDMVAKLSRHDYLLQARD
ncbi:methyltransferase, FkbM family [Pseudoxanthobacter soli DSM 19599]|uniref:Methyltransferase, FkbM family n=1 Tax=Pseudoxanthobacter soli DSM 19599 TaxID=1123029 RepID=A0A1M7ZQD9_9HYPH|nr:FkbM family methyltransferase [Pseudoxanthobacter soli]SHO66866.1 methyltransferase, FkbM family [Pseudoxanthobacter soli DSM 19599]